MVTYPQHEKLAEIKGESQAQVEFIEWLREEGFVLCQFGKTEFYPTAVPIRELLARYHDIDLDALEREKLHLIEEQRRLNGESA